MSINIDKPITTLEKADAAGNLVEQMMLAHKVGDEKRFNEAHAKCSSLMFNVVREIETLDETIEVLEGKLNNLQNHSDKIYTEVDRKQAFEDARLRDYEDWRWDNYEDYKNHPEKRDW